MAGTAPTLFISGSATPGQVAWRSGAARDVVTPFAKLPPAYPLTLDLRLERPMYVYVASHDLVRGTIALFPSTRLHADQPANPLPIGPHAMPGTHDGVQLEWLTGDGVGATSIAVIASDHPLPDLANTLGRCLQMGNAAFPKSGALGTYAPAGGMSTVPPRAEPADPLLRSCRDLQDPDHDGALQPLADHPGVYAKVLRFRTSTQTPVDQSDELRERVQQGLGPLGDTAVPAAPAGGR